ncbi:glycosyltransferase family 4 protein [Flavobacterium sp. RSSB_23]|uniref:glycosyltransferase family 4 protein n=1 Tax=Flavobacterium sp. RSSB_23 TaxID=3447668 RepID=UPI003F3F52FA
MNNLLHISANQFGAIEASGHTSKIWEELSTGFDNYYVFARSKRNKFEKFKKGKINLILIPKVFNSSKIFVLTSLLLLYYVRKYKINRILAQDALAGGISGIFASKIFKIPIMIEIHGDFYFDFFKEDTLKKRILSRISKFVFKSATKVRSLSSTMTALLNHNLKIDNIALIPNRVNCNFFSPPKTDYEIKNDIVITSVGRFVRQKGYDVAIKVVQNLSDRFNIKLILIGGGSLKNELKQLIGESKNVQLIDWIEQENLIDLLKKSDIYIQPSLPYFGEAMPRTILESMAMGLPIISTTVCAIPGILNSENSILVTPGSVFELENAIISLVENSTLREKIGREAYSDASKKYNWNKMFDLYRKEINDM